jgi:hypothetical protein
MNANPGQTLTVEIKLRDLTPIALVVTGEANDFTAAGEDGTPKLLLEPGEKSPFSIKDWVQPLAPLNLLPQQIKSFPVTIKVPANADPGGHYGVIRFTGRAADPEGTSVSLNASLGTLLLVNVAGDIKNKLTIEEFYTMKDKKRGWFFESAPLTFVERIKNEGNTHEQPTGKITITDMFGKLVAVQTVNQPPRNVLPASIRKFEQPLGPALIGDKWLFGKYTAELEITYANKLKVTDSLTFWVIPWRLILIAIAAIVALIFAIRFGLKRYADNVLGRSRSHHRRRRR